MLSYNNTLYILYRKELFVYNSNRYLRGYLIKDITFTT